MGRMDIGHDYSGGCFGTLSTPGSLLKALDDKESPEIQLCD